MRPPRLISLVLIRLVLVTLCLPPAGALADRAAADRCATALTGTSRTMYDGALPAVAGGTAVPDALRGLARGMVMTGAVSREVARPMAEAAGACLAQLR